MVCINTLNSTYEVEFKNKMNYFELLPEEIITVIFLFTDFESCVYLKLNCKQFNRIIYVSFITNRSMVLSLKIELFYMVKFKLSKITSIIRI